MKQPHDRKTGRFCSPNPEPLGKSIIGVRLPASLEAELRQVAGDDLSKWIREAIATRLKQEKLAREEQKDLA